MKELRNTHDKSIDYSSLEEAKGYFACDISEAAKAEASEDFIGQDFESYWQEYVQYAQGIESAETLEQLCEALNWGTDKFDNGSIYYIHEF